jgi:hypothetical protein
VLLNFDLFQFHIPNINKSLQQGMTLICEKKDGTECSLTKKILFDFFCHQLPKHTTFMMPKNNKRDL